MTTAFESSDSLIFPVLLLALEENRTLCKGCPRGHGRAQQRKLMEQMWRKKTMTKMDSWASFWRMESLKQRGLDRTDEFSTEISPSSKL